jgi:hypothetical protein
LKCGVDTCTMESKLENLTVQRVSRETVAKQVTWAPPAFVNHLYPTVLLVRSRKSSSAQSKVPKPLSQQTNSMLSRGLIFT